MVILQSFMFFLVLLQPWSPFCSCIPGGSILDFADLSANRDAARASESSPHFILMPLFQRAFIERQQVNLSKTRGTWCSLTNLTVFFFKRESSSFRRSATKWILFQTKFHSKHCKRKSKTCQARGSHLLLSSERFKVGLGSSLGAQS